MRGAQSGQHTTGGAQKQLGLRENKWLSLAKDVKLSARWEAPQKFLSLHFISLCLNLLYYSVFNVVSFALGVFYVSYCSFVCAIVVPVKIKQAGTHGHSLQRVPFSLQRDYAKEKGR